MDVVNDHSQASLLAHVQKAVNTGLHVHKCVLTVMSKKFKINKE